MQKKPVDLIGGSIGWGAKTPESAYAPKALFDLGLIDNLLQTQASISWRMVTPPIPYTGVPLLDYESRLDQIIPFSKRLANVTASSISEAHFPLVLGGDHSTAIGTWSGIVTQLKAQQQFGLIWIDAHMDSHTLQTTPSKAIHGMPLAVLLGHGDKRLIDVGDPGAKLSPAHVVLIGVRSFEEGEAELLKQLNVKVYYIDEVKKQGFANVFAKAVTQVSQGTLGFGISVDLDVFDPSIAPGVNAPEPNGLMLDDVCKALPQLNAMSNFMGLEIVEYNPDRDEDNKTAILTQQLIQHFL